jgi:hypothetical protein
MNSYADDMRFYLSTGTFNNDDLHAWNYFFRKKISAPVVKLGDDSIAVFDFTDHVIKMIDGKGKEISSVAMKIGVDEEPAFLGSIFSIFIPMPYRKWNEDVIIDDYFHDAYTSYRMNGMISLSRINISEGTTGKTIDIPLPFPRKLRIYKGVVYFLSTEIGRDFEKCRLIRMKLL